MRCVFPVQVASGSTNATRTSSAPASRSSASRTERDASTRESQPRPARAVEPESPQRPPARQAPAFQCEQAAVDNKGTDVNVVEKCGADDCQVVAERPLSHRVTDAGLIAVGNIDIIAPPRGSQQFVNFPGFCQTHRVP